MKLAEHELEPILSGSFHCFSFWHKNLYRQLVKKTF